MKKTIETELFLTDKNELLILELHKSKQGLRTFIENQYGKFECLDQDDLLGYIISMELKGEIFYLGQV